MLWCGLALPLIKLLLKEDCKYVYIVGRLVLFSKPDKRQQEKLSGQGMHYSLKNVYSQMQVGKGKRQ